MYTSCQDTADYGGVGWCPHNKRYEDGEDDDWGYCTEDCPKEADAYNIPGSNGKDVFWMMRKNSDTSMVAGRNRGEFCIGNSAGCNVGLYVR